MSIFKNLYSKKTINYLIALIVLLGFMQFLFTLNLPIFTDEILWRYHFTNGFQSSLHLNNYVPGCFSEFKIEIPTLWLPSRFIDYYINKYFGSPTSIRVEGIIKAIILMLSIFFLNYQIFNKNFQKTILVQISLFFIGAIPFLTVTNRPEQSIYIFLALFFILCMLINSDTFEERSNFTKRISIFFICILPIFFFASHPKTLFFLPAIFIPLFFLKIKNLIKLLIISICLASVMSALSYSKARTACQENTLFSKYGANAGYIDLSDKKPLIKIIKKFSKNIGDQIYLVDNVLFQSEGLWIKGEVPITAYSWHDIINIIIKLYFYFLLTLCLITIIRNFKFSDFRKSMNVPIMFSLLISVFLLLTSRSDKPYYDGFLYLTMSSLTFFWIIDFYKKSFILNKLIYYVLIIIMISQIAFFLEFTSPYLDTWKSRKQVSQYHYLTFVGEEKYSRDEFLIAASKCQIDLTKPPDNLFVDESAYSLFSNKLKNVYMGYFMNELFIPDNHSFMDVYKKLDASGYIAKCNIITPGYYIAMSKYMNICCLPAASQIKENKENTELFKKIEKIREEHHYKKPQEQAD